MPDWVLVVCLPLVLVGGMLIGSILRDTREVKRKPRPITFIPAQMRTLSYPTCRDFLGALALLDEGQGVRRADWPLSHVLVRVPGSTIAVMGNRPLGAALPGLVGHRLRYTEHLDVVDLDQLTVTPWCPRSEDLQALDWVPAGQVTVTPRAAE